MAEMAARQLTLTTQGQSGSHTNESDAASSSTQDQVPVARVQSSNATTAIVQAAPVYRKYSGSIYEVPGFTRENVENCKTPDGYMSMQRADGNGCIDPT